MRPASVRTPLLLMMLVALGSVAVVRSQIGASDLGPTVILVSFDGFRWDYPTKAPTPHLDALAARGVQAQNLIPSFPSKTFPNHYSIATGLYPGHHGIVANNLFDEATGRRFSPASVVENQDGMWWGGVPIWTLVERAGRPSAPLFWVGSEAPHGGIMPRYWRPYDEAKPASARVDEVLTLLDRPASDRPVFLTLYFEDADTAGHRFGPDSAEVRAAIVRDDGYLGELTEGLASRSLSDRVNIVVVSDHGMAKVDDEHVVVVEDYVSADDVFISDINPTLGVFPRNGKDDLVYRQLQRARPHLRVFRRDDLPDRWHLRGQARVPPIFGVADEGWQVLQRETIERIRSGAIAGGRGQHGYDPQLMSMRGIFVAAGPAFRRGVTVAPFENVSIYNVLARIIGVTPAPNDGDPALVGRLLR